MAELGVKNLLRPDRVIRFPGLSENVIELGDWTVARVTQEPGWRWSTHMRPHVGGEWCQARHVGMVLSGRYGVELKDGAKLEFGPSDVYLIPPGHDGYTLGDEPCVYIEWSGIRTFGGYETGSAPALVTLLMTDLVGSTELAGRLGDRAWRDLLSSHLEKSRRELDRYQGREINTAGDGLLAVFGGPVQALKCAAAICARAGGDGLQVRSSVHVGEVEMVGDDVRGVTVHEAARILGLAQANEILVSELTRALAASSGFLFKDRGTYRLKGLPSDVRVYACSVEP